MCYHSNGLKEKFRGMCQCLFDFFKIICPLSTTSNASSKDLVVHLPRWCGVEI